MNILHVIIGLNIGGAETMLKRLVSTHLGNTGYRHTVISLTDVGILGQELQADGVEVHALHMRSILSLPRVLWDLVRLIKNHRPDIVQTWMYHADLLGGVAARIAGNRQVIWGVRTTYIQPQGSRLTLVIRWLCARLSRYVPRAIVCAAEASKRSHIEIGYDPSKMQVIPNGYDFSWLQASPDERDQIRDACGIDQDMVCVGSLGRFHADKDQQSFVTAAGLLAARYPQLRVLLVGRGLNWANTQLAEWISATCYRDRFVLLDERKDVPQCLAVMDIFCLHSRTEGFPNALAEAMAMGLPCVSTDVGDAAVLLADTGVLVPKEDSVALAKGIGQLLDMDQNARRALGTRAKAKVEEGFSMTRFRERFESIYRQVLNEGVP